MHQSHNAPRPREILGPLWATTPGPNCGLSPPLVEGRGRGVSSASQNRFGVQVCGSELFPIPHSVLNHTNENLERGRTLFLQYLILSFVLPFPNRYLETGRLGPFSVFCFNTYKTECRMAVRYTDLYSTVCSVFDTVILILTSCHWNCTARSSIANIQHVVQ